MPTETPQAAKVDQFRSLHRPGDPLLIPNPWDLGSARLLVDLGFQALATTSGGFAGTLGRLDGSVTRDEALAHARAVAGGVEVPVSADLENCFADSPEGVAETVRLAVETGLAGCSVEDFSQESGLYDPALARERVAAAVEAAGGRLVLTARAENHIRGNPDLADTIARLQAYQEAGADVLYAPGVVAADDVRALVGDVDRPVNVLALPGAPPVPELAALGVARISVGSSFAGVAWGAVARAGLELLQSGTYGYLDLAAIGSKAARSAFT
jgi:2-methylisocitrate lyase-like PEP mutase family enzyme